MNHLLSLMLFAHVGCAALHAPPVSQADNKIRVTEISADAAVQSGLNPLQYGADPTGKTSSTDAFNKCVQFAVKNHIGTINITGGQYLITQSGIDAQQRPYGVTIENANGLNINGSSDATILIDIQAEPTPINAFRIFNSSNVIIRNVNFRAEGDTRPNRGKLYTGAGIFTENVKNVEVENGTFKNTFYAVCAFRSQGMSIHDNTFINGNYDSYMCMPKSAILLFSTGNSKVMRNTIYGSLVDGDLSLFGLHTDNNIVSDNKLYGYAYNDPTKSLKRIMQGITVDQGPSGNTVSNNLVYGYFYGIDVKAATFNNLITNNTLQYCKVGISERKGEAVRANASANNKVTNNTIIMGGDWKNDFKFYGLYQSVGIFSENRSDMTCSGNVIKLAQTPVQSGAFAGIVVREDPKSTTNTSLNITDNTVDFDGNGDGAITPPVNSDAMFVSNITNGMNLSKNIFQIAQEGKRQLGVIKVDGPNTGISMSGNQLPQLVDRTRIFKMGSNSTLNSLKMNNNSDKSGIFDKKALGIQ